LYTTKKGEPDPSYVIITTPPTKETAWVHDRMPAIIEDSLIDKWLDPNTPLQEALAMLKPYTDKLEWYPVSNKLNNLKYNAPDCLQEDEVKIPVKMVNPWAQYKQQQPPATKHDGSKEESESSLDFTNAKDIPPFRPQQLPPAQVPLIQPNVQYKRELEDQALSPQKKRRVFLE